jgi:hypothetical protein
MQRRRRPIVAGRREIAETIGIAYGKNRDNLFERCSTRG